MKTFIIQPEDNGIRLNRFLERVAPSLPASLMYRALRQKNIKRNGKRCEASDRLSAGDTLTLWLDDSLFIEPPSKKYDFERASAALDVLYEDQQFAVLYKPAGLLCHATLGEYGDSLVARFQYYLYKNGTYRPDAATAFAPALCNRLDRGTEGLVLAAKSADGLRALDALIRRQRLDKRYLCIVADTPPRDGSYSAHLAHNAKTNTAVVSDTPSVGSKEIVTAFRTLAQRDGLALVECDLITGRHHQIRAHLAHLGAPILGDGRYGDAARNRRYHLNRQALCAYSITFRPQPEEDALLYYLHGKTVSLTMDKIWFVTRFFPQYANRLQQNNFSDQ